MVYEYGPWFHCSLCDTLIHGLQAAYHPAVPPPGLLMSSSKPPRLTAGPGQLPGLSTSTPTRPGLTSP